MKINPSINVYISLILVKAYLIMQHLKVTKLFSFLAIFCVFAVQLNAAEPLSNAHKHINHLIKSWPDAPQSMGLLDTAMKEAAVAVLEIQLARVNDRDLTWIKLHIKRARHALQVRSEQEGGLGFGLVKASYAIAKHTKLASADDASINVKLHSKDIINSAYNTASIAKKMSRLCAKVEQVSSIAQALAIVSQLQVLAPTLLLGADLDKDGKISAFQKEGGLNLAKDKLTFMARAEGLIKVKNNN
jgi:hypothetical protein